jgi:hypothetical protein
MALDRLCWLLEQLHGEPHGWVVTRIDLYCRIRQRARQAGRWRVGLFVGGDAISGVEGKWAGGGGWIWRGLGATGTVRSNGSRLARRQGARRKRRRSGSATAVMNAASGAAGTPPWLGGVYGVAFTLAPLRVARRTWRAVTENEPESPRSSVGGCRGSQCRGCSGWLLVLDWA